MSLFRSLLFEIRVAEPFVMANGDGTFLVTGLLAASLPAHPRRYGGSEYWRCEKNKSGELEIRGAVDDCRRAPRKARRRRKIWLDGHDSDGPLPRPPPSRARSQAIQSSYPPRNAFSDNTETE